MQERHGRDAVATYLGNPNVHSLGALTHGTSVPRTLRSKHVFSATSVDQLPHHVVAWAMYGHQFLLPVPDIDREKRTVGINLQVVPGPRVNVRRIVFKGNTRTADEVLRREMRQFEGAWYSQAAIDRSKIRLQRLGQ